MPRYPSQPRLAAQTRTDSDGPLESLRRTEAPLRQRHAPIGESKSAPPHAGALPRSCSASRRRRLGWTADAVDSDDSDGLLRSRRTRMEAPLRCLMPVGLARSPLFAAADSDGRLGSRPTLGWAAVTRTRMDGWARGAVGRLRRQPCRLWPRAGSGRPLDGAGGIVCFGSGRWHPSHASESIDGAGGGAGSAAARPGAADALGRSGDSGAGAVW